MALFNSPVLADPSFNETNDHPFGLQTDASATGLGMVLTQERNYGVTECDCLAVVYGISKFREYLAGYQFKVITDHTSLKWLNSLQNSAGRLARWSLELQVYDMEIIHRKEALHQVPDALWLYEDKEVSISSITETKDSWFTRRYNAVLERP